eukprot:3077165-Rhodomonas_salina.1
MVLRSMRYWAVVWCYAACGTNTAYAAPASADMLFRAHGQGVLQCLLELDNGLLREKEGHVTPSCYRAMPRLRGARGLTHVVMPRRQSERARGRTRGRGREGTGCSAGWRAHVTRCRPGSTDTVTQTRSS